MNLSKKIITICKTIPDVSTIDTSAIEAGEIHLCTKCFKFKKNNEFGKDQYWCKECKNLIMKKNNDEVKLVDKVGECGRKVNIRSYNTHLKSKLHKRRLDMVKENKFTLVS